MQKFENLKAELLNDVEFAVQNKHKQTAVQIKLNRVNDLIEIYNELQQKAHGFETELSAVEMDIFKHLVIDTKMIKKIALIFEMIGVDMADVAYYLKKQEWELKELVNSSNGVLGNAPKIEIKELFGNRLLENADFSDYIMLKKMNSEVVAAVAMDNFLRLKKKFK